MLSASSRRNQNYSDQHSGQTLFQFLKRKKKSALTDSIVKNNRSLSKSRIYQKQKYQNQSQWTPHNQTKRQSHENYNSNLANALNPFNSKTRRQHHPHNNHNDSYRQQNQSTLTPKRVRFADSIRQRSKEKQRQQQRRNAGTRSFIEMISPFRKKQTNNRSPTPQPKGPNNQKQLKNVKEHYTRKNLNERITQMKDTIHTFIQTGKNIKDKSHSIIIQLKPLLKFIEDNAPTTLCRKSEDIRLKLRSFENIVKGYDVDNSVDTIQGFHIALSEHLNTIQAQIRSQYQKKDIGNAMKVRQTKDTKIQQLREENYQLQKELDILHRKFQKTLQNNQNLQSQLQTKQNEYSSTLSQKINEYHEKLLHYEQQLKSTTEQLEQSLARQKQLEKGMKDAQYTKQEHQRKFRQESDKITSSKEEYLLNQIMVLKKEFQTDMAQITNLYNNKQADHLQTIRSLETQLAEFIGQRQQDKILQEKWAEETNLAKMTANKFKKQNELGIVSALACIERCEDFSQSASDFREIYEDL